MPDNLIDYDKPWWAGRKEALDAETAASPRKTDRGANAAQVPAPKTAKNEAAKRTLIRTAPQDLPKNVADFCRRALDRDRGLVTTPFAGHTESTIAIHWLLNEKLRSRMDLTASQVRQSSRVILPVVLGLNEAEIARRTKAFEQQATDTKEQDPTEKQPAPKVQMTPRELSNLTHPDLFTLAA